MIRLVFFIVIVILIVLGFGYWRYTAANKNLATPQSSQQDLGLVEVPKTPPNASLEDRVKSLEDTTSKLVTQINEMKISNSQTPSGNSLDSRLTAVESAVTDLKARVSALEKSSPPPVAVTGVTSVKYPLYIPMGADGGPWTDQSWNTLGEYQVSINPDDYSGYSGMQLEVNFRLAVPGGTGSVRLYNVTDGVSVSLSEVDTTSTSYSLYTSGSFKLNSGTKTYTIQVQNTIGQNLYVQSARIKVNF